MQIATLPVTAIPGLQTRVPEIKERSGPDRDQDADDKSAAPKPVMATPNGLGGSLNKTA